MLSLNVSKQYVVLVSAEVAALTNEISQVIVDPYLPIHPSIYLSGVFIRWNGTVEWNSGMTTPTERAFLAIFTQYLITGLRDQGWEIRV